MSRFRAPSISLRAPRLEELQPRNWGMPLLIGLVVLVPLILLIAGVGVRKGKDTALVVNEVYLDTTPRTEWVELLNTTSAPLPLDGWLVGNNAGPIARLRGTIAPQQLLVVKPEIGGWNPAGDAVVLWSPQHKIFDSVSWGKFTAKQGITSFPLAPKPQQSITRNPQGLDSDSTADWQITRPSQGTQSPASLSTGFYRVLFPLTNYLSLIAGFILWGAFLLIGLIARRFEALTGQRAYWAAMVIAPIGIVIYNAIQSYAFFTVGRMTDCKGGLGFSACQQGWAFTPLLISAAAMLYVVYRFFGIARDILDLKEA